MKPDVKKIIADIKATEGNRKFCNGLAGTLQDDNYASSICKYVKTVTPERIDLLIEYAEKLEAEVTDLAVQLANAESKCRELAAVVAENAALKTAAKETLAHWAAAEAGEMELMMDKCMPVLRDAYCKTPATDAFLAEVRAQGVEMFANAQNKIADDEEAKGNIDLSLRYRGMSLAAGRFAAQLRKGAAL